MENVINFLSEHWESITAFILWVFVRLVPTKKNYDLIEGLLKLIGRLIPNRKKPLLSLIFFLFAFGGAFAQLNGNFKSVRFVNVLDSNSVLPINATIYYNEQSDKFRAYENGVWKDLINEGDTLLASDFWPIQGTDTLTGDFEMRYYGATKDQFFSINDTALRLNTVTGTESTLISSEGTNALMSKANSVGAINNYVNVTDTGIELEGVGFSADAGALSYTATSNQILLANPASTFATSIFGGEIQLDDVGGADDLTINDSGLTSTGTNFTISTDGTNDLIFTSNSQTARMQGNALAYAADYSSTYNNRSLVDKEYVVNAIGSLQVLIVNIGDWDMDTDADKTVAHGLADFKQIRDVSVIVRDDTDASYYKIETFNLGAIQGGINVINANIVISRLAAGLFDSAAFNSTGFNRGFVTIWYVNSF